MTESHSSIVTHLVVALTIVIAQLCCFATALSLRACPTTSDLNISSGDQYRVQRCTYTQSQTTLSLPSALPHDLPTLVLMEQCQFQQGITIGLLHPLAGNFELNITNSEVSAMATIKGNRTSTDATEHPPVRNGYLRFENTIFNAGLLIDGIEATDLVLVFENCTHNGDLRSVEFNNNLFYRSIITFNKALFANPRDKRIQIDNFLVSYATSLINSQFFFCGAKSVKFTPKESFYHFVFGPQYINGSTIVIANNTHSTATERFEKIFYFARYQGPALNDYSDLLTGRAPQWYDANIYFIGNVLKTETLLTSNAADHNCIHIYHTRPGANVTVFAIGNNLYTRAASHCPTFYYVDSLGTNKVYFATNRFEAVKSLNDAKLANDGTSGVYTYCPNSCYAYVRPDNVFKVSGPFTTGNGIFKNLNPTQDARIDPNATSCHVEMDCAPSLNDTITTSGYPRCDCTCSAESSGATKAPSVEPYTTLYAVLPCFVVLHSAMRPTIVMVMTPSETETHDSTTTLTLTPSHSATLVVAQPPPTTLAPPAAPTTTTPVPPIVTTTPQPPNTSFPTLTSAAPTTSTPVTTLSAPNTTSVPASTSPSPPTQQHTKTLDITTPTPTFAMQIATASLKATVTVAATAAAVSTLPAAGSGGAAADVQGLVILSQLSCAPDILRSAGSSAQRVLAPLNEAPYGALLGNLAIVVGFAVLHSAAGFVLQRVRPPSEDSEGGLALARYPSLSLRVAIFLLPGSLFLGFRNVFGSQNDPDEARRRTEASESALLHIVISLLWIAVSGCVIVYIVRTARRCSSKEVLDAPTIMNNDDGDQPAGDQPATNNVQKPAVDGETNNNREGTGGENPLLEQKRAQMRKSIRYLLYANLICDEDRRWYHRLLLPHGWYRGKRGMVSCYGACFNSFKAGAAPRAYTILGARLFIQGAVAAVDFKGVLPTACWLQFTIYGVMSLGSAVVVAWQRPMRVPVANAGAVFGQSLVALMAFMSVANVSLATFLPIFTAATFLLTAVSLLSLLAAVIEKFKWRKAAEKELESSSELNAALLVPCHATAQTPQHEEPRQEQISNSTTNNDTRYRELPASNPLGKK